MESSVFRKLVLTLDENESKNLYKVLGRYKESDMFDPDHMIFVNALLDHLEF